MAGAGPRARTTPGQWAKVANCKSGILAVDKIADLQRFLNSYFIFLPFWLHRIMDLQIYKFASLANLPFFKSAFTESQRKGASGPGIRRRRAKGI